jgi:hypothetical protein
LIPVTEDKFVIDPSQVIDDEAEADIDRLRELIGNSLSLIKGNGIHWHPARSH